MPILSEIWVYPVKSLGGFQLKEAHLERRGLQFDRRWMLVDEEGEFVSQREIPEMALLQTAIEPGYLVVFSKNDPNKRIRIPLQYTGEVLERITVGIWSDKCKADLLPKPVNDWFSDVLHQKIRMVYMPDTTRRATDGRYAPKGQMVGFADGFPFLIIGQASLDDLNERLEEHLLMNRFRPNFVCTGSTPFEEDAWTSFRIGKWNFQGVKKCARCIITTINQETARKAKEPLKTLALYREFHNKIYFGQNLVWMDEAIDARVSVGDLIEIL